jgi:hypothetical protein
MAVTLEELEKRLFVVEEELALRRPPTIETPAQRGARLLHTAKLEQPRMAATMAKILAELGISGAPIGAENLQQMMLADGVQPEENSFSREIIAAREE